MINLESFIFCRYKWIQEQRCVGMQDLREKSLEDSTQSLISHEEQVHQSTDYGHRQTGNRDESRLVVPLRRAPGCHRRLSARRRGLSFQSSLEVIQEEPLEESAQSLSLDKELVYQATDRGQRQTGYGNESAVCFTELQVMRTSQPATWDMLVSSLVPVLSAQTICSVTSQGSYHDINTMARFLEKLVRRSTSSIYVSWPDSCPVVCDQYVSIPRLRFEVADMQVTVSTSYLGNQATIAVAWLYQFGPIFTNAEGGMAAVYQLQKEQQALPVPAIEPAPPPADLGEQRPALEPGVPASLDLPMYMESAPGPGSRAAPWTEPSGKPVKTGKAQPKAIVGLSQPRTVPEQMLHRAGPSSILAYTGKQVAEQLTLLDAVSSCSNPFPDQRPAIWSHPAARLMSQASCLSFFLYLRSLCLWQLHTSAGHIPWEGTEHRVGAWPTRCRGGPLSMAPRLLSPPPGKPHQPQQLLHIWHRLHFRPDTRTETLEVAATGHVRLNRKKAWHTGGLRKGRAEHPAECGLRKAGLGETPRAVLSLPGSMRFAPSVKGE
ncbi:uncharacterized protein LOC128563701 isoform X2 [Nycticebus coucang]|uniref:uncharacterized protein LOC128563701 isoform X2 n=1 Tax=Nycticebus coucang TaxID=9470 RepID=UPI00234D1885|nr:uncharacterized protein LOC128563701 isoform X2 [Nycticebus coucang]